MLSLTCGILKKVQMILFTKRNRPTNIENKLMVTKEDSRVGVGGTSHFQKKKKKKKIIKKKKKNPKKKKKKKGVTKGEGGGGGGRDKLGVWN